MAQAWYRWMLVLAGLFGYINAWAQAPDLSRSLPEIPEGYWLQAEVYAEHTSGALEGMTTYRVYMNCTGPLDYVSSCSGDDSNPLRLLTGDAGWYNSPFNASPFAVGLNPMLYDFIPEIQYDSFLTIGAEDATTPASMHPGSVWGEIDATEEFDGDGDGADLRGRHPRRCLVPAFPRTGDGRRAPCLCGRRPPRVDCPDHHRRHHRGPNPDPNLPGRPSSKRIPFVDADRLRSRGGMP